jgi:hypothetical protein
MINFDALNPETRCAALVGEFLRRWSRMQGTLHDALASAMKLDDTMRAILCANIQLRDKIHILRTIVDVSAMEKDDKAKFKKMLTEPPLQHEWSAIYRLDRILGRRGKALCQYECQDKSLDFTGSFVAVNAKRRD